MKKLVISIVCMLPLINAQESNIENVQPSEKKRAGALMQSVSPSPAQEVNHVDVPAISEDTTVSTKVPPIEPETVVEKPEVAEKSEVVETAVANEQEVKVDAKVSDTEVDKQLPEPSPALTESKEPKLEAEKAAPEEASTQLPVGEKEVEPVLSATASSAEVAKEPSTLSESKKLEEVASEATGAEAAAPSPISIEVTDKTDTVGSSLKPQEKDDSEETVTAITIPTQPAEIAEAGILEEDTKPQEEAATVPVVPVEADIKKESETKEKLELELTPPECLPSELDTTGIEAGGNWVIKRAFWEQAEKVYEKIMKTNNELYDQQVKFVKARNEVDKDVDTQFRDLGFEQGQMAETLNKLVEETNAEREQPGLTEQEREFLQTLKEKQRELDQLKKDLVAVDELDNSLGKVMENLTQQVGACRKYEKQAWEHFKEIGKELNDKKARLLFYEMEGFFKTVEKNRDYVSKDLWNYFNDTTQQINDHLNKIKNSVDQLKQKGIDLNKEFERFAQANKEKDKNELKAEQDLVQKELAEIAKQKEALAKSSWKHWPIQAWDMVKEGFVATSSFVANFINSIMKLIGLKK